jgi:GNAT superfamily N-acetyltransferase
MIDWSASLGRLTDGAFRAYVEDVVLTPDARGAGIGQLLVERLLQLTPPAAVTTLFCSPQLTGFYARSGFRASSQIVMHRHPSA